ncbi:MAG: homoserine O-succinyltransferase [Oscillospiraceae bacterium]|nr:homoserine O-succinyltransferase [Oscillospiraceae bacterium]
MPINIPDDLPAIEALRKENIFCMTHSTASHQDIRPLRILILNLMPKKIETETQILRLLSNTPIQVDIDFLQMKSHVSKNTPRSHLNKFYYTFDEVKDRRFDGLIITGAPVEQLEYEDVDYWGELCEVMDWSLENVYSVFHICWGAQAGLYHHYGVPKYALKEKMFGLFEHRINDSYHPLVRGFDDNFTVPHSRYTEVREEDIVKVPGLKVLTYSRISGVHIVTESSNRLFFCTGHSEYDRFTLGNEYYRDLEKGLDIKKPYNYFPDDDVLMPPRFNWRCHANLLFSNWINYCVYQSTPYDLDTLTPVETLYSKS